MTISARYAGGNPLKTKTTIAKHQRAPRNRLYKVQPRYSSDTKTKERSRKMPSTQKKKKPLPKKYTKNKK
jgi:hypothetical protein